MSVNSWIKSTNQSCTSTKLAIVSVRTVSFDACFFYYCLVTSEKISFESFLLFYFFLARESGNSFRVLGFNGTCVCKPNHNNNLNFGFRFYTQTNIAQPLFRRVSTRSCHFSERILFALVEQGFIAYRFCTQKLSQHGTFLFCSRYSPKRRKFIEKSDFRFQR